VPLEGLWGILRALQTATVHFAALWPALCVCGLFCASALCVALWPALCVALRLRDLPGFGVMVVEGLEGCAWWWKGGGEG
jgi:hypothetical protein